MTYYNDNFTINNSMQTNNNILKIHYSYHDEDINNGQYPIATRKIVYGHTYVKGDIVYNFPSSDTNNPNQYNLISIVVAFADHEIYGFEAVVLDGDRIVFDGNGKPPKGKNKFWPESLENSLVNIRVYDGRPSQTADKVMQAISNEWTVNCTMTGIAYLCMIFQLHSVIFPDAKIPHFGAIILGKKIRNLQNNKIEYTNNPALCLYDYLTTELKIKPREIDENSFIKAIEDCDEEVVFPWMNDEDKEEGDTDVKYSLNGIIDTKDNTIQTIKNILTTMDGNLNFIQGKWHLQAGAPSIPNHTINENDLAQVPEITYNYSINKPFNTVKIVFSDKAKNYSLNNMIVSSSKYLKTDQQESHATLQLPFTTVYYHAIYLAIIAIRKSQPKILLNFPGKLYLLSLPLGSSIKVNLPQYQWQEKNFKLIQSTFNPHTCIVNLLLEELDNRMWDTDAEF